MAKYKMVIHTDTYECGRCSKKNWEAGTRNDYMLAINGLTKTLYNMREVMWQLELFRGNSFLSSEYSDDNPKENHGLSDRYVKFLKKNTVRYYEGSVKVPFKMLYDIRQYDKALDGCYMEIVKAA